MRLWVVEHIVGKGENADTGIFSHLTMRSKSLALSKDL